MTCCVLDLYGLGIPDMYSTNNIIIIEAHTQICISFNFYYVHMHVHIYGTIKIPEFPH